MSTKLTGYVWDACASSGMKLSSVAIMARLADFSSDEGVSWPSSQLWPSDWVVRARSHGT
jgi:hypothetical protein